MEMFLQCQDKRTVRTILQSVWDATSFIAAIDVLTERHDNARKKELLKIVQQSTIDIVLRGSFHVNLDEKVMINKKKSASTSLNQLILSCILYLN